MSQRLQLKLEKVLLLLLVGELYGLNTLNKLLDAYGVKSNDYQQLWSQLSCDYLVGMMNDWLWGLFSAEFGKRISQSDSTQSRQEMTLMIDGSIFAMWLKNELFAQYFGKYYSGQYGKTVYGFNVLVCGMNIGEVFYPLHFRLRRKTEKDAEIAADMLSKVHKKLRQIAQEKKLDLPTLYLSVDSGFYGLVLLEICQGLGLIYIGVPKFGHLSYYEGEKVKFGEWKKRFEQAEQAYQKANPNKATAFVWRIRVTYKALGAEVTMLLFRLKGSKKVSIIYANDRDIKAKTLRRRWFQRTKIELFFRLLKNDFKIQQSTIRNRLGFMKKLAFALVKGVYTQRFVQKVKQLDPQFERMGFAAIRNLLIFHQLGREWLDRLFWT